MSVSVTYRADLTVAETLETNVPAATSKVVTHSGYNTRSTISATTTPPAAKVATFEQALTDGAATIDLTALTGTNGAAVVGSGLRVQAMKIRSKSTNANPITIAKGASNGYAGFGAGFSLTLGAAGAEALILGADGGADIAADNKTLDVSGTGAQVLECQIVLG